jgi:hypothetical protein
MCFKYVVYICVIINAYLEKIIQVTTKASTTESWVVSLEIVDCPMA